MPKKKPLVSSSLPLFSSNILNDGTTAIGAMKDRCLTCTLCKLHETRTNVVFGEGLMCEPKIAFVGEGPGRNEDEQGRPFVGDAGDVLMRWLASIRMTRDQVYICNTVNCRPPKNRTPEEDELEACSTYLHGQLLAVKPKVIVALGATAAKALARSSKAIGELRGQWLQWNDIPLRATYHPAYILRNAAAEEVVLKDFERIALKLETLCIA